MMPSDYQDTKESTHVEESQDVSLAGTGLSDAGISAMQGDTDGAITDAGEASEAPPASQDSDLITIHPGRRSIETLPSPETEPHTIKKESESPQPPEGWRPGGPEGRG